jgi:membrane-associated PAP2 superfamily phosphatase
LAWSAWLSLVQAKPEIAWLGLWLGLVFGLVFGLAWFSGLVFIIMKLKFDYFLKKFTI